MGSTTGSASTTLDWPGAEDDRAAPPPELALVLVWAASETCRLGEVLLPRERPAWFGREPSGGTEPRLPFCRQRPGETVAAEPASNPFLSRQHLRIERKDEETLSLLCAGRRKLLFGGRSFDALDVRRGDVFEIDGLYSFFVVERPARLPASVHPAHAFGYADAGGVVGESPAAWALRGRIEFVAARCAHVLITGPSGTGKELVARAIHAASARARKALVSRNAATLPSGLIDAELFGNCANYPNPGMPERPGLIGEASGSSLFLDEIGELGAELQAHLLRVLDAGEYQRLGEARARVADLRVLAATNRGADELKHDLAARLALHVDVPGLAERRDDVPLIARRIVQRICEEDRALAPRFLRPRDGHGGEPRLSSALVRALVLHDYVTHVRELEALLWRSIESSPGEQLELTAEVQNRVRETAGARTRADISEATLRAALERHAGVQEGAWRDLGLSSRHALRRLMRKYGVT